MITTFPHCQSGEVGVNSADEVDVCPLHVAAANGHAGLVTLLLSHGANPDQRTSSGWTPLHQAAYHGHLKVVEELMVRQDLEEIIQTKCDVLTFSGWRSKAGPSCF